MKKLIHDIGQLKFVIAIYFMATIILATIGSYFNGLREFSFVTIWQILGISIVFGSIHFIQLSKMSTIVKLAIHSISSYVTLILFSYFCNWGFTETASVFLQFTLIFIVIYVLVFLSFAMYYKNEEIYLNKKLDEYKQKRS